MEISPVQGGMASTINRYNEDSAKSAMASVRGAVAPVFDTGKQGTVDRPNVNLAKETFDQMITGTITYNSVAQVIVTGGFNVNRKA